MKTQNNKQLSVRKHSIVELNNLQLVQVNGGTVSITTYFSPPYIDEAIRQSSLPCQDNIFQDGF
ncbi:hypothetical protein N7U66_12655 [Lacinutrix neustonica]|uniref:Uncharacterized protein n=1 Tax=Lacinutrix neustonica TaxID=2980107 RepID=A0A9E8SCI0_9FLAO|nr:hypothetical protein [Lacinutrix neustonica]WAC01026.1 hypothetical protein N7U66_12655 [Lacinutrix neustonica]